MNEHNGKRVVITGGGSGIGFAMAKLLVDRGARVVITGRSRTTLEAAQAQLDDNVMTVPGDVSSGADLDALGDRVKKHFGTLDALFVNAGISPLTPFESTSEETFDELFAINARGAYFTVQKLAPLLSTGAGVVLTTSVANVMGIPETSAYAASKAALRSMARSFSRELLARGVRVNAISSGPIDTGALEKEMPRETAEQFKSQVIENVPMQRFGTSEEVARAAAFLAFEATYTTGTELVVDGGSTQL